MNYIEININNNRIYIDIKRKIITINNTEKEITEEKLYALLRIIRIWRKEYNNPKIIDGEKFLIKISTTEGIDTIEGNGDYPSNYSSLKKWISDIHE